MDFSIHCNHERPGRPLKFCSLECTLMNKHRYASESLYGTKWSLNDLYRDLIGQTKAAFMLNSGSGSTTEQTSDVKKFWRIFRHLHNYPSYVVLPEALLSRKPRGPPASSKRARGGDYLMEPKVAQKSEASFVESCQGVYRSSLRPENYNKRPLGKQDLR